MPVTYVNRPGDTYFLQSGKTKNGKDHFWLGRKMTGAPVERLPAGYEIHECPETWQPHLRKIVPSRILPEELELVRAAVDAQVGREMAVVEIEGKDGGEIVVYLGELDIDNRLKFLGGICPMTPAQAASSREFMLRHMRVHKMMRFRLKDERCRHFAVDRWCFRGSIDGWHTLDYGAPLAEQIAAYVQHLGKESFFDLV